MFLHEFNFLYPERCIIALSILISSLCFIPISCLLFLSGFILSLYKKKKKKNHLSKSIKAKPYFIAGIFFFFNVSFLRAWLELQTCCVFLQIKLLVFTVCFYVLQH